MSDYDDRTEEVNIPTCMLSVEAIESILVQWADAQSFAYERGMTLDWMYGADGRPVGVRIDVVDD